MTSIPLGHPAQGWDPGQKRDGFYCGGTNWGRMAQKLGHHATLAHSTAQLSYVLLSYYHRMHCYCSPTLLILSYALLLLSYGTVRH